MKSIKESLAESFVRLNLNVIDLESLFDDVLNSLVARKAIDPENVSAIRDALFEREKQVSTAIGHAVAVPHAYLDCISRQIIVFVRLAHPLNLGAPDGIPTRFFFFLLGPPGQAVEHLDTLTNIARLMSDDRFRFDALNALTSQELFAAVEEFELRTAAPSVTIAGDVPESLKYTGRLCGGLWQDIKRRLPHYKSDFTDGLHTKSISSTLFLFFACLAPAVTFGGIMATLTGNHIGVVEMIVGTAICGVLYALFAGQPLIILGGTGPLLIFTMVLYNLCVDWELPFLETRAWIGIWTGVILLIMAATDSSCLLRFFTRFTDEIFAALISIIFIVTALGKLHHEVNETTETAAVALLLALGTLYIAHSLMRFRKSRYLNHTFREFLADFGPAIALTVMTLVGIWFVSIHPMEIAGLPAPESDSIRPTYPIDGEARSWLLDLFHEDLSTWTWLFAIVPAVLVAVLVYVDQNITARLVNSRDHKLKKGEAYHYDLALMGVLIVFCSLLGLPWLVAATVRSLNHVRSLATVEEVVTPVGESRERILHVRETRMTGLAIHLLVGLSVVFLGYLKVIPMAVLYGLFLFMGIVSMAGNQFFERLGLWIMDSALYPSTHYIRKVPIKVIHVFTLIQLVCLGILAVVEVGPPFLAILFPLVVVMLVPLRIFMERFFVPEHLEALDAEEEPEDEETHWSA